MSTSNIKPTNHYAPFAGPVDDNTVLPFGRYAGWQLAYVPADYLREYKEANWGVKNTWLLEYINKKGI